MERRLYDSFQTISEENEWKIVRLLYSQVETPGREEAPLPASVLLPLVFSILVLPLSCSQEPPPFSLLSMQCHLLRKTELSKVGSSWVLGLPQMVGHSLAPRARLWSKTCHLQSTFLTWMMSYCSEDPLYENRFMWFWVFLKLEIRTQMMNKL